MAVRTVYSTGDGMGDYGKGPAGHVPNSSNCAVAIGSGTDGRYQIAVIGPEGAAYALIDRDELLLIADAITKELHQ